MPKIAETQERWAAKWYSTTRWSGVDQHFIFERGELVTRRTRKEMREWISAKFGYIATRKDLRQEPHGWRMPKAVRVKITVKEL